MWGLKWPYERDVCYIHHMDQWVYLSSKWNHKYIIPVSLSGMNILDSCNDEQEAIVNWIWLKTIIVCVLLKHVKLMKVSCHILPYEYNLHL